MQILKDVQTCVMAARSPPSAMGFLLDAAVAAALGSCTMVPAHPQLLPLARSSDSEINFRSHLVPQRETSSTSRKFTRRFARCPGLASRMIRRPLWGVGCCWHAALRRLCVGCNADLLRLFQQHWRPRHAPVPCTPDLMGGSVHGFTSSHLPFIV